MRKYYRVMVYHRRAICMVVPSQVQCYKILLGSNFSAFSVEWRNNLWPTAEHAYQAAKFEDNLIVLQILQAKSAHDAKKIARANQSSVRKDWDKIKISVKEFQEIFSLNESGLNCREIESLTGIPKSTVFYWLKKHDT